jgi:hypothetical protein
MKTIEELRAMLGFYTVELQNASIEQIPEIERQIDIILQELMELEKNG